MVYCGVVMFALAGTGMLLWFRGRLLASRRWLALCVPAFLLPQLANQAGWIATEVGRQPWIVQNLLKTQDAFSTNVSAGQLWFSLIFFSLIYAGMLALFIFLLLKKIRNAPEAA